MSDIVLAVTVDVGAADAGVVREQLTESILAFAVERGLEATVTPEDHWSEHELAKALRTCADQLAHCLGEGNPAVEQARAVLEKYDLVYGGGDEQTPAPDVA